MEPFLQMYRWMVLDQYVDVLSMAYARAKEGQTRPAPATPQTRDAQRLEHGDIVLHSVVEVVEQHVRRVYTVDQLYTLLQLFAEEQQRFTAGNTTEVLRRQATRVNRRIWKTLRNFLTEHVELSSHVDWSLAPTCWQPLLAHLARECILWAYAAALYVPDAPLPGATLRHMLASPISATVAATMGEGSALQWGPIMETLMIRLRVDMLLRHDMAPIPLLNNPLQAALVRRRLRRAGAGQNEPLDGSQWQELVSQDDRETGDYDPDDVTHLRTFIHQTNTDQRMRRDNLSRRLHRFHFSQCLLLRFAYTGSTHVQGATPIGDVRAIRAQIVEALTRLGFRPEGDEHLGNTLGWLTRLNDKRQHFGEDFDLLFRKALLKTFTNTSDPERVAQSQAVFQAIRELLMDAPTLQTSLWLGTCGSWDAQDPDRETRLSRAGCAATLQQQMRADFLTMCGDADVSPVILEDLAGSAQAQEYRALLLELWQAYEEWQTYPLRLARRRQRLRKYFTALCHRPEDKGLHSPTVMSVHAWLATTEALCAAPDTRLLQYYTNVWQRLARLPVPASDIVYDLDALRPYLAQVPGLPRPGASTVMREA